MRLRPLPDKERSYKMTDQQKSKTFSRRTVYVGYILGGIIGAVLTVLVVRMVTPSMMIITEQSGMSFDETVAELKKSIYKETVQKSDTWVSTMVPCIISVREDKNGTVYISRVNMKLMAKMFDPEVSDILSKKIVNNKHKDIHK